MEDLNIINKIGIKILLKKDYPVVCETLERIGIVNKIEKKIFPSCYCIKYSDQEGVDAYKICHFKEMFLLQNKHSTFNDLDKIPSQSADSHASTIIFQIEKASVFFKFGLSLESLVIAFSLSLDNFLLTVDSSLTV